MYTVIDTRQTLTYLCSATLDELKSNTKKCVILL